MFTLKDALKWQQNLEEIKAAMPEIAANANALIVHIQQASDGMHGEELAISNLFVKSEEVEAV